MSRLGKKKKSKVMSEQGLKEKRNASERLTRQKQIWPS
jgi:hypothetical protein